VNRPQIAPDGRRIPRYSPHMALRPRVLAAAALAAVLQACSSMPTLLDSDVPMPDGMSTVRSADIRRADGTVTGGRFLLAGGVPDAAATLESTAVRFVANGWRVDAKDAGLDLSTARFSKGSRIVTLSIARRTLEPDMSTGTLEVTTVAGASPSTPPG